LGRFTAEVGFRRWKINLVSTSNIVSAPGPLAWAGLFNVGRSGRGVRPRSNKYSALAFLSVAIGLVDRHVRSPTVNVRGIFTTTRRLLNYALAETTAVINATVMININIVTAVIACFVILNLLTCPPFVHGSKLADRSVHRG
jgi:hypothetical protein